MHLLKTLILGACAFVGFATAQSSNLAFTSTPSAVTAGQGVTITYTAPNLNNVSRILSIDETWQHTDFALLPARNYPSAQRRSRQLEHRWRPDQLVLQTLSVRTVTELF